MHLEATDWIIVGLYLAFMLYIGLRFRERAGGSITDFFLGGRGLPWYVAGLSMVATTFAADTPLWVTERVAENGISGNWLWWNMLIGGMLTTFFFARLWRRSGVVTELEFIELRYSGRPAALLRGFKSVYMGVFLNVIIIGWVNAAMITIISVFFDVPVEEALWYTGGAMLLVAAYSSLAGLLGVAVTDSVQFIVAMAGCIVLAVIVVSSEEVGGIAGLKEKLPAWRFDFFPRISGDTGLREGAGAFSLSLGAFLTFGLVQWWASWYPGAEPGGGGYVSQRMMSAKSERHALFATLFFQLAHYCLRPWPWILVGLSALVLYPNLDAGESGKGFVLAMKDYLPAGLKGLLFVAFLSAYMSTVSTQLNWGASYLVNDLYRRFVRPPGRFAEEKVAEKHYVLAARLATVVLVVLAFAATTQIGTIDEAAKFLISCGAGLGMVLILRWYWWRINAWSEITATVAPFLAFGVLRWVFRAEETESFLFTVAFTTVAWLAVTFATRPVPGEHLRAFCRRVRPQGRWGKWMETGGGRAGRHTMGYLFLCWFSAVAMAYSILFATGKTLFMEWTPAFFWGTSAAISFFILKFAVSKSGIFTDGGHGAGEKV